MINPPEYNNDKEDKWYHWKGVAPPERVSHGIVEDDIEALLKSRRHKCVWIQEGPNIVCRQASEFDHGHRIGVNKRLVRTGENGEPILADIVLQK